MIHLHKYFEDRLIVDQVYIHHFLLNYKKTFKFTKDKKVVKVKVSDLKVLESEGLIKIYQPKDVKALLTKQGLKRDANNVFETMMKNNEVLIEGEIPDDIIKQVSKDQIKSRNC